MKRIKRLVVLAMVLLLLMVTGCGASSLLVGSWTDDSGQMKMEFDKEGNVLVTAYSIPLPATYEYQGDVLTIHFSENVSQSGVVTFFGDNEFCWENIDTDGQTYQDYYTRES